MGRLTYVGNVSLDGCVADASGSFDFTDPDDEVFASHVERERTVGTHLYGRRAYELMAVWERDPALAARSPAMGAYAAAWQDADKVVHSTTLDAVRTRRTRLARTFDPDAVRRLVDAADRDVEVFGPTLAASALRAGLVDDVWLYVVPVVLGGGLRFWPDDVRLDLELVEERRFPGGTVLLRYRTSRARGRSTAGSRTTRSRAAPSWRSTA